jgi:hypothetical protein
MFLYQSFEQIYRGDQAVFANGKEGRGKREEGRGKKHNYQHSISDYKMTSTILSCYN